MTTIDYSIPADKTIIGLTGNIATGKSAVMRLAADQGALTIDADRVVHGILAGDTAVQKQIAAAFGDHVLDDNCQIIRPALGQIVFNDPNALVQLEQIVHPAVHQRVLDQIHTCSETVIMIEAIKLLEGKLHTICAQVWVTTCTRARQLERLQICRGLDEATAVYRIDAQNPQTDKITRADVVIDTNGLMNDTQAQFVKAWGNI